MGHIIDDRPYTPDPGQPGTIYIIAQKRGKNGNVKRTVALRATGGARTVELVERFRARWLTAAILQSALQQSRSVRLWREKENF